jgi:hypothetical protein
VKVSTLGAFGIGTTTLLLMGTALVSMWFDAGCKMSACFNVSMWIFKSAK